MIKGTNAYWFWVPDLRFCHFYIPSTLILGLSLSDKKKYIRFIIICCMCWSYPLSFVYLCPIEGPFMSPHLRYFNLNCKSFPGFLSVFICLYLHDISFSKGGRFPIFCQFLGRLWNPFHCWLAACLRNPASHDESWIAWKRWSRFQYNFKWYKHVSNMPNLVLSA